MTPPRGWHGTPARLLMAACAVLAIAVAIGFWRPSRSPSPAATSSAATTEPVPADGVVAYYFHTTYRCTSCRKIEAYSKIAIDTAFEGDLASGRLQWRVVNIEDKGNEHYVQDYGLFTKSLILSERRAGREVRWKNLAKVWELLGDEPAFVEYVQKETREFLAQAP